MNISDKGINFIKSFEGCILKCYLDSGGVKTAGYGTTGDKIKDLKVGDKITKAQAEAWLAEDLLRFDKQVLKVYPTTSQQIHDANVSFAYNCGCGALSNCKNQYKKRLHYVKDAKAHKLYGLVRRRNAETLIFDFDYYTNDMHPIHKFISTHKLPTIYKGNVSGYTRIIQIILDIDSDSINGAQTQQAVKNYQKANNLVVDGIVGPKTWASFVEYTKGKL